MMNFRQEFFRYRNGVVAEALKNGGDPHKTVFGVDVPRLGAIAREGADSDSGFAPNTADMLWADTDCRESRLLACWLWNPATMPLGKAVEIACGCISREEADILAFRLLKRMPEPESVLAELTERPDAELARESLRRHLS